MSFYWNVSVVVIVAAWLASPPRSIGELAQREKIRRQLTPKATAVLTNIGQLPEVQPVAVMPSTGQSSAAVERAPSAPPAAAPADRADRAEGPGRDETWWRARIIAARAAVERDQVLASALQARINALQADVVNWDDPAWQAKLRTDLQRALAELERMQRQIAEDRQMISVIQDEARRLDVPPGWIRQPYKAEAQPLEIVRFSASFKP